MTNLVLLMQLTDSMFPSGAFVHSYGLETYTQENIIGDVSTLQELLTTQLFALAHCDMLIIKEAMSLVDDLDALRELDEFVSALKIVYEVRLASYKVGRQFLRSAIALYPHDKLHSLQAYIKEGNCMGHHTVVHGVVYESFGFDEATALSAFAYQFVAGQSSAAMKLMSIGQSQVQGLIYTMQGTIDQAVEHAMNSSLDQLESFTPALDIRAMQHQYLFRRLFHS